MCNTTESFRAILKRMQSEENYKRCRSICTKICNEDEERIWELCEKLWHPEHSNRTSDIEKYEINPNLDNVIARRYLQELTQLLDKLGWQ